jgi:hypothetical protein
MDEGDNPRESGRQGRGAIIAIAGLAIETTEEQA